jgi:hypothetical protein
VAGGGFGFWGYRMVGGRAAPLDYETATSHTLVVRATDSGGLSLDKTLVITVQNINELINFDVQHGAAQRSYIRYVDLVFESGAGLNQLINEGRIHLTRFTMVGISPTNVSLAGKLRVVGNRIVADFGSNGIGGNRNSAIGNGYYRFNIDADRNGAAETQRNFYRLFGDTNSDRIVNSVDQTNVNQSLGRRGSNLNADVNGDGVVNTTDRDIVRKQLNHGLAPGLPIDD